MANLPDVQDLWTLLPDWQVLQHAGEFEWRPSNQDVNTAQKISREHLKSFSRCQKQYQLKYAEPLAWPSDTRKFALGQRVHKLMEYQSLGFPLAVLLQDTTPEIRSHFQALAAHPVSQWEILASEWGFHVPLPIHDAEKQALFLTGSVDRIARDPQGKVWIIDWKTGTGAPKEPQTDWQTRVYLYAVYQARALLGLPDDFAPEDLGFLYVEVRPQRTPAVELKALPLNRIWLADIEQLILQTVEAIVKTSDFKLPETCPDRFCPYRAVCGIDGI
jgi:ATP-dependent helicase/DNAse subunit B